MTKIIMLAFISLIISGCGGGSSGTQGGLNQVSGSAPELDTGVPVQVIARSVSTNTNHQCNSPGLQHNSLGFSDITRLAGIEYQHGNPFGDGVEDMSGGVGVGDFDNDGWLDLYAVGGEATPNKLLRNKGDGTFEDIAHIAGVDLTNKGSGPSFADINGDGLVDIFVGGVTDAQPALFINQGDETFINIIHDTGLIFTDNTFSASWGDYDKDNDLDLVVTHWTNTEHEYYAYFWINNGDLTFRDGTVDVGMTAPKGTFPPAKDRSFTPTFADINNNGWLDLLFVVDGGFSKVFVNKQDGTFENATNREVITDRAGMGSIVGDYDNDGDLDWFVTSISTRDGVTNNGSLTPGNRFYQNQGDGSFVDKTDETGTRHGYWGWAACFADLNNDTFLDIFHVNGMLKNGNPNIDKMYETDPSRLFLSNGNGTFSEQAVAAGIDDKALGRGVVCFDYDRDGDQDIFVANYNGPPSLFCNHGNNQSFINIRLLQKSTNTQALGARIYLRTGTVEQMRELRSGNQYVSQSPTEAHFGLAQADSIDEIRIIWPDGKETKVLNVEANQFLEIRRND